jgi:hypothetical protein
MGDLHPLVGAYVVFAYAVAVPVKGAEISF